MVFFFLFARSQGTASNWRAWGTVAGAGTMLVFTVVVYGLSVFVFVTSTSALIFIFAPIYTLAIGMGVVGLVAIAEKLFLSK